MPIINTKHQHGFTMIEVLIAAFVLGIGLLGLAALQAQSLQFNYSAYQRSQATILAYDIIDRIRANESNVQDYNTSLGAPSSTVNCQATAANCSAADMAAFDIDQWKCTLGGFNDNARCTGLGGITGPLADGDGSVDINTVAGRSQITVTLQWTDNRTTVGNRTETFTVSTVL